MRKVLLFSAFLAALAAPGCRRGPHVDVVQTGATFYKCLCSEEWWRGERVVALCRTAEACTAVCQGLDARCVAAPAAAPVMRDGGIS